MTVVLVSTSRRRVTPPDPSGHLYAIDLDAQRVIQRSQIIEPAYREVDSNPRGGMRGCKGIAFGDGQVILANFAMIFRYDHQWNLMGAITHPSCASIHDIALQDETLWVTAARADLLMQFDLSGRLLQFYDARQPYPALEPLEWKPARLLTPEGIRQGRLDLRDPRTHQLETYDRAHVNAVCVLSNGDLLVSLGFIFGSKRAGLLRIKTWLTQAGVWAQLEDLNERLRSGLKINRDRRGTLIIQPARGKSAVLRISPAGEVDLSLLLLDMTVPSHSLHALPDDTALYLNTTEGSLIHFDAYSREILFSQKISDGFLRGIGHIAENTLVLGSSGELITFDLSEKRIIGSLRFSDDPKESVYDIKELPEGFALPPVSLEDHFKASMGFRAASFVMDKALNSQLKQY